MGRSFFITPAGRCGHSPAGKIKVREINVRIAVEGLRRAGHQAQFGLSGAATDANVFNARGLLCVNLADGSAATHTPDEHIAVGDLEAMVEVTLGIVDAARDAA